MLFNDGMNWANRLLSVVFALVMAAMLCMLCACAAGGKNMRDAVAQSDSSSASLSEQASESASAQDSASTSKAAAVKALDAAKLTATTQVLEYSDKTTDPLKLVKCENDAVKVSTEGSIDLKALGEQTVKYTLELDGQSAERAVSFTVRDTKAPAIVFADDNPRINQGDGFDPLANVSAVTDEVDGALPRVDAAPAPAEGEAGLSQLYEGGWYVVGGGVDTATPGTYAVKVTASDKNGNVASREFAVTVNEVAPAAPAAPAGRTYILNTNTHKFHNPGCKSVKQMKDSNKQEFTGTRDEVIAMGYDPCGNCHP